MSNKIRKAVFPLAGLGSRFLPATKANPKEMLTIVDKPIVQYAVEEAISAGITHMIFVTSSSKRAIEDHFDQNFELERKLKQRGQSQLLSKVRSVTPSGVQFTYVRQSQPLGLGDAILCAEHVVGAEPFAVLLADDLIDHETSPCLQEMVSIFGRRNNSIVAVHPVARDRVNYYGIVNVANNNGYSLVQSMVEKPLIAEATSNLAVIGRYVFSPTIFSCLRSIGVGHQGELQLTDAIVKLLDTEFVEAFEFRGKCYDCGTKIGYLEAILEFGLNHPEIAVVFKESLLKRSAQLLNEELIK